MPRAGIILDPRLPARLARATSSADIVHIHMSVIAPAAWCGAWAATRLRRPCVVTIHSSLAGFRPGYRSAGPLLRQTPLLWSGVSPLVRREIEEVISPASAVRLLPNAVVPSVWKRHSSDPPPPLSPSPDRPLRIVSVMRLSGRKRPGALLEIARGLRDRLPDRPFLWEVAGDGPWKRRLEREAASLGLSRIFRFHGFLPRPAVRDLLLRSHLFVLPSVRETFGIAALEARTAGLPVVARRECGVATFIRNGPDGRLVGSDADMVTEIGEFLGGAPLPRPAPIPEGSPLSWDALLEAHLTLYDEAALRLSRRRRESPPVPMPLRVR